MPSTSAARRPKLAARTISALDARSNFGAILDEVADERRSLVIEKRGTPKAVLLSIQDYVRLAVPEPEVLAMLGAESTRQGTDSLTDQEIQQQITEARASKKKR